MPDQRAIRVFVSSTFRDMQDEREELVKRIFPAIRRLCEDRGVAFSEVDLRWGVTDEQKAEGAVLPICLAEIDRSRPYFIGLLGQRYGWVPESLPDDVTAQLPWLHGLAGTSVTEIEILHGVLNDPAAVDSAFFYLRDPAWMANASAEQLALLGESPSEEDIAALGADVAERTSAARRAKLDELRTRIYTSGAPAFDYSDVRALGEQVHTDLVALVDRLYPASDVPDAVARQTSAHDAYSAAQLRGTVRRPAIEAQLDTWAAGAPAPLTVAGPPGAGATEIAVAWLDQWRADHPADVVIRHHVRATDDAAQWVQMANRITAELYRDLGFADPPAPSTDAAAARSALFAALGRAATSERRSVILVDGVDLLVDIDGAPDLTWLPPVVPPGVCVLLTTTGARPVDAARHRGWPVLEVPPLDENERRAMVSAFLGRYAKGLDEVHVATLLASPSTGNPLYLRTVLDELRQHGDHFTIGAVIAHYLSAPQLPDLLALVLQRYEGDYERDRPGLVRDAMRGLWAARRGLTEPELLDALGGVPHAVWSPLVLAAEVGLVTRSGLLGFATEPHREAVQHRYLRDDAEQRAAHRLLAETFAGYQLGPRVVEELPWQQLAAGDVDAMVTTISDEAFTQLAYRTADRDLIRLWARAEEAGRRVVDGYRATVDDPSTHPAAVWEVARLVTDAGYPAEALRLNRFIVDEYRKPGEVGERRLSTALVNLGRALLLQGDLVGSEAPLREAVALAEARAEPVVLRAALGNLALGLRDRGETDEALTLFAREEALCREAGDTNGLQISLGNRAQVLRQRGDYAGALAVMGEQEELCRSIGDSAGVARALAAQGAVLGDQGQLDLALQRFAEHRRVSRELGDLRGVAESSISEANTLREMGRRDEAATLLDEAEVLLRRLDDEPLLFRVLDLRGRMALEEGRWADAERLANESLLTARSAGVRAGLTLPLGTLGMARRELGNIDGARAAHTEEEEVAEELHDPAALATARANLAAVDIVSGDLESALRRYALAEPVLRAAGAHGMLVPILNNRWQVHMHRGDTPSAIDDLRNGATSAGVIGAFDQQHQMLTKAVELLYGTGRNAEAEPVWLELEAVCRHLEDQPGLQRAVGERGLLMIGRGDLDGAAPLLDEQEQICRSIGDQAGLAACIGNRAILLRQRGDLAGSLACIDEQLTIAKAAGNGQGVLFAIANRGEVLGALGRVAEGLAALQEARTMAAGWGLAPMVAQLDQMVAAMRSGS
jgi:tetratricopeptide (TPR) repeat protein